MQGHWIIIHLEEFEKHFWGIFHYFTKRGIFNKLSKKEPGKT